jgi:hypothetical protein
MRFMVQVVKHQACEVEVEAKDIEQAMKAVDMNAQAGHYKHWEWKDTNVYARDAEECD